MKPNPLSELNHFTVPWAICCLDQATGMVSAQLGVAIGEAFVRLRAYAYAQDQRLSDVARDIVARRLRLAPDGDRPRDGER
jgi:ANTAR domain